MAQYRFEVHWPSGRKEGSAGAVAKGAYINRQKFYDEGLGKSTTDYSKNHEEDLLWSAIFVDKNLRPPAWVHNPEKLWNEASAAEKRRDALECQDAIGNLPHELTLDQNKWWVTDFIRENLTRGTGRVVNVAFHAPSEQSDDRNIHAHLLWSLRKIGPDGFEERLPPINKQDVERLREKWAERGAKELRRAGFELEADRWAVGHLTLEKQREHAIRRGDHKYAKELDREPQRHMGPKAMAMERDDKETHLGNINRDIQARNVERQTGRTPKLPGQVKRTAGRTAERVAGVVTDALESFFARTLTPQEKERGRIADLEKSLAAEAAEQQRRWEAERGRDR